MVVGLIISYLLGSIPSSVLIGSIFYHIDIRKEGSGNPGATNTFRVLGKKAGAVVLLLDLSKGYIATHLPYLLEVDMESYEIIHIRLMYGVIAILGHIFPIYLLFRGGKGAATLLGVMLALHFNVTMICVTVFFITLLISQYVSLSTVIGALTFLMLLLFSNFEPNDVIFKSTGAILFIVILWTHRENIKRILNKNESKISLFARQKINK